jgi:hypothetical protein
MEERPVKKLFGNVKIALPSLDVLISTGFGTHEIPADQAGTTIPNRSNVDKIF